MKDELKKITIKMEDGTCKEAEIVFAFNEAGEDYILYELNNQIHAVKVNDNNEIIQITDERELEIVEEIYNDFLEDSDGDE
ncbi:MAG: DUF1292 domain-containing protein [Metamycoplasmataceae bacterium]